MEHCPQKNPRIETPVLSVELWSRLVLGWAAELLSSGRGLSAADREDTVVGLSGRKGKTGLGRVS
jgi:hypothetical protein